MRSFISIFSGAGGLDLGLEQAGWDCLYACDSDEAAVATLRANVGRRLQPDRTAFSGSLVEQADVASLSGARVLAQIGRRAGQVELLAGGPPCQSWSSAGLQRGFGDPRGQLMDHYIRLAKELGTRWLLLENVRGLLTARGPQGKPGEALASIRRRLLHEAGFQTHAALLNAADYGVPQRRVRLFLVGYRDGDAPTFPAPTHADPAKSRALAAWRRLGDCIGELPAPMPSEIVRPTGELALELSALAPGSGVRSPGKTETTRPGGHWGYKQGAFVADLARPARTVTANSQQDWIRDPQLGLRKLSIRECAALQSFPSDWVFVGSNADRRRLIGNAVPPGLARAIGSALLALPKNRTGASQHAPTEPLPLSADLAAAIRYTEREEARNGASRRLAPAKRRIRPAKEDETLPA